MQMNWLNKKLKEQIKDVFEPRYNGHLTERDISEIALSLSNGMEIMLKANHKKLLDTPTPPSDRNSITSIPTAHIQEVKNE